MTTQQGAQLIFDLAPRPAHGREDFLVSIANRDAVAQIDAWRDWPGGRLALTGPPSAGKTHLAAVWATAAGAQIVAAEALCDADVPDLATEGARVVVEDADRLAALSDHPQRLQAERALFHLHNLLAANRGSLMVTGRGAPVTWRFSTPDLTSRMTALPLVRIAEPDDALLSSILVKLFADRQLQVGPEVVKYLTERLDRSFDAAARAVEGLDRLSLERGGPVTRPLAARYLAEAAAKTP